MRNIGIVGAGLVGSLLAIFLKKKGFNVDIYERRPDMRKNTIPAGRSINLALSERGWKALIKAGIDEEIRKVGIPMSGRFIHPVTGESQFQPYGKDNQAIFSVSRATLNSVLMDLAEHEGAKIHFQQRIKQVNLSKASILTEDEKGQEKESGFDHLLGADGAYSAARLSLQMTDRFEYSQHYLEHGYKELTIPPVNGDWALPSNALHIWPRQRYMLIALPNLDKSFTCTLFFPFEGEDSFASIQTPEQVRLFFERTFPDAVPLMPTLENDFINNPTSSLVTVKCFPWSWEDKLLLIGDAAHAIVPFFGQGMNCGFEDCTKLDELLDSGKNMQEIFETFQQQRKPNTDAIAELAQDNFVEMRDRVADPKFLLRKKIEARFHARHPEKWLPLYSMVTFSHIDYAQALEEGRRQEQIMSKIMEIPDLASKWDSEEVESLIDQFLLELA